MKTNGNKYLLRETNSSNTKDKKRAVVLPHYAWATVGSGIAGRIFIQFNDTPLQNEIIINYHICIRVKQ